MPIVWKVWKPQTPGPSRTCPDLYMDSFTFLYLSSHQKKSTCICRFFTFLNRGVSNTYLVINDNIILERLCLSGSQIGAVTRHATHNIYTIAVRNSINASPILSADLKNNTSWNSAYERPMKYSSANTLPLSSVISLYLKETNR